jgi:hypothetical protein
MGVSRLAGRNSAVTRLNTPKVREKTAGQDALSGTSAVQLRSRISLIASSSIHSVAVG